MCMKEEIEWQQNGKIQKMKSLFCYKSTVRAVHIEDSSEEGILIMR